MVNLLTTYSIEQIIIFLIMVALALKEAMNLIDFFKSKTKSRYDSETAYQNLEQTVNQIATTVKTLVDKVDVLTQSVRDSNKSWIVENYRQIKHNPHLLDDITMDLLERRYENYQKEGGNSYITSLMSELREIYKSKGDE